VIPYRRSATLISRPRENDTSDSGALPHSQQKETVLTDPRSQASNESTASLNHHQPQQHHRRSLPSLECNSIRHTTHPHLPSACVPATEATTKQIAASKNTFYPLESTKSMEQAKQSKNLVLPLIEDLNNLPSLSSHCVPAKEATTKQVIASKNISCLLGTIRSTEQSKQTRNHVLPLPEDLNNHPSLSSQHTQPTHNCTRHQATIGQQRAVSIGGQTRATYNKLLNSAHRELSPSLLRHSFHRTIIIDVLFSSRRVYRPPSRSPERTPSKQSQTTNSHDHPGGSTGVTCNDPSAPPPTETLLRLLLALNDQQGPVNLPTLAGPCRPP
jgi:hypothetical protein